MLYWYCSALFTARRSALQLLHHVQAPVGGKPKLPPPPGQSVSSSGRVLASHIAIYC
jgi:hypothetical protein